MLQVISITVVAAICVVAVLAIRRPVLAVPIFLSMYAIEQIVFAGFGFVVPGWLVNVAIGTICVAAIAVSVLRQGLPRLDWPVIAAYLALLGLAWLSLLWTRAPNAGYFSLTHFSLEATLALALGFLVIRSADDVKHMLLPLIALAVLVGAALLAAKVPGIGGRVLIVEGGTVLSPSKFLGFALIAVLAANQRMLAMPVLVRLAVAGMLVAALFLMGARAQFVAALLIGIMGGLLAGVFGRMALIGALTLVVAYLFAQLFEVAPASSQFGAVAQRYDSELLLEGWAVRLQNVASCLVLSAPLLGHGIMDWSVLATGIDQYIYPHNSLAQLYYELGLLGLGLFLFLAARGGIAGYRMATSAVANTSYRNAAIIIAGFLIYDFLLSQKEGTFMSCLGFYLAVAACASLWTHGARGLPRAARGVVRRPVRPVPAYGALDKG